MGRLSDELRDASPGLGGWRLRAGQMSDHAGNLSKGNATRDRRQWPYPYHLTSGFLVSERRDVPSGRLKLSQRLPMFEKPTAQPLQQVDPACNATDKEHGAVWDLHSSAACRPASKSQLWLRHCGSLGARRFRRIDF